MDTGIYLLNLSSNTPASYPSDPTTYEEIINHTKQGLAPFYNYINIDAYRYQAFAENSCSAAIRLGYSNSNEGSALNPTKDPWLFTHTLGLNMGFNLATPEHQIYKIYFVYETQAITEAEARQEIDFIDDTLDTLKTQISDICNRVSGLSEVLNLLNFSVWIYSNPSGRTRSLTNIQRDAILRKFTNYSTSGRKIGIYCTHTNYSTMSIGSNSRFWIIDYNSRDIVALKNEVSAKHGELIGVEVERSISFAGFNNRLSGSYWLEDTGVDAKYNIESYTGLAIGAQEFPDISDEANSRTAYSYPFNTNYIKGFHVDIHYDGPNFSIILVEGVHFTVTLNSVTFESTGSGYPSRKLKNIMLNIDGRGLFTGHLDGIIERNGIMTDNPYKIEDYVEPEQPVYAYTGSGITPGIKLKNFTNNFFRLEDFRILEYRNNIGPGTGQIIVLPRYEATKARTKIDGSQYKAAINFSIQGGDITKHNITISGTEFYYTGSPITPTVTVEEVPTSGYTVIYSNNINPGTASATVTGVTPYIGSKTLTFSIVKEPISHFPVIAMPNEKVYTGEPITVGVSVTGVSDDDYTYTFSNNINVGNAIITVTAKETSKYSGSATGKFRIIEKDINDLDVQLDFGEDGTMFTGFEIEPEVEISGVTGLVPGEDYVIKYYDNINVDSLWNNPRVVIECKRNLKGTRVEEFDIFPRDIASVVYAYTSPSSFPDFNYEGGRTAYYVNDAEKIYYLNYPEDIVVTQTDSEWVDDPYRGFFRFHQKYIGVGNFEGEFEYSDNITFDPSDVGTYDFGLDDLYGDQWPQWSVDPPPSEYPDVNPDYDKRGDYQNQRPGRVQPDDSHWDFGIQENDYTCKPDPRFESQVINVYNMNKDEPGDLYRYDFNVISGDPDNPFDPGREFILEPGTPVFVEAYSILPFDHREGSYFVYDSLIVNNRIKMTDSNGNARKAGRLVCWVNVSDLNKIGIITVGDKVMVNGKLFKDSSGGGGYIEKTETVMYVVKALNTSDHEYPFGLATYPNSVVLGYANADSLEEIAD